MASPSQPTRAPTRRIPPSPGATDPGSTPGTGGEEEQAATVTALKAEPGVHSVILTGDTSPNAWVTVHWTPRDTARAQADPLAHCSFESQGAVADVITVTIDGAPGAWTIEEPTA